MSTHRTTIMDLPAEVLIMVFECYHATAISDTTQDDGRSLFRLSHVCRFWREVVLSCSVLWASNVDISPKSRLSQVVLDRAGSHNLDIKLREILPRFARECLAEWLDASRQLRTRSLNLQCFGNRASPIMVELIGPSLPMLLSLEVACYTAEAKLEVLLGPDGVSEDEVVIRTLAIEHAPALTRVVLENCLLSWDADIYSQLTHLEISVNHNDSRVFHDPDAQYSAHDRLCFMIASLHHIVDLKLDIFPRYGMGLVEELQPILLPPSCQRVELRSLERHTDCCWFASSLVVPPGTALTIVQVCRGNTLRIMREFSRTARAMSVSTIDSVGSKYLGTVVVYVGDEFSFWTQPEVPTDLLYSIPGGHITLHFEHLNDSSMEPEDSSIIPSCSNMFRAISWLDFSELKVLQIPGLRYSDEDEGRFLGSHFTFLQALAKAEKVEVLILPMASASLLRALAKPSSVTGKPQFPFLSSVAISLRPNDEEALSSLRQWFEARDDADLPAVTVHVLIKRTDYMSKFELWEAIEAFALLDIRWASATP